MSDSSLNIKKSISGRSVRLSLEGHIDESADYSNVEVEGVENLIIDFEGITLINSSGIQKWIEFLANLPQKAELLFDRCPPSVVNQINMFKDFTAGKSVEIKSVLAPFFCETCDKVEDHLLDMEDALTDNQVKVPELKCSTCGGFLEFDEIEDKFFLFMKRNEGK